MTDEELKDLVAKNAIAISKLEAQSLKTDLKMQRLEEIMSSVGHNNGDYAEEYFYNALSEKMIFAGIKYDNIKKNIHIKRKRLEGEFDVVMYNGNSIALIECKYKAHEKDLIKLVDKKVNNFRELNPDYASYKIYCGLGSFSFYPELEEKAKELGVAILKQKGDLMEITTDNIRAY